MSSDNKHNNKYQKTEKRILEGYLSELKRVGAGGGRITLKGIAKASGLPWKTVLNHYNNFSELESSNMKATKKRGLAWQRSFQVAPRYLYYIRFLKNIVLFFVRFLGIFTIFAKNPCNPFRNMIKYFCRGNTMLI